MFNSCNLKCLQLSSKQNPGSNWKRQQKVEPCSPLTTAPPTANNLEISDMAVQKNIYLCISLKRSGHLSISAQKAQALVIDSDGSVNTRFICVIHLNSPISLWKCLRGMQTQSMNICESSQWNNGKLMNSRLQNCCPHTLAECLWEDLRTVIYIKPFRHQSLPFTKKHQTTAVYGRECVYL